MIKNTQFGSSAYWKMDKSLDCHSEEEPIEIRETFKNSHEDLITHVRFYFLFFTFR